MDQFLERSAAPSIFLGLVGMLVVVGLLIYVLVRNAGMITATSRLQRRGIELAAESVALQRESNRLFKEFLDRADTVELAMAERVRPVKCIWMAA